MFIDAPTTSLSVHPRVAAVPPDIMDALGRYPSANVGDAMERLGLMDAAIQPMSARARCSGNALTVLTRDGDNLAIHRALDDALPGDVLVINALGGKARAVFGDLLAEICLSAGVVGVVIDGLTRDRDTIAALGLPVWARGISPAGPAKHGPGAVGVPVACGGAVVNPGDVIVADGDGVAVVPASRADQILARLGEIDRFEEAFRQRVRQASASITAARGTA
jgi:regulator of RNase E activity RraA